ncbi:hypothetical protein [Arthrobacter globiformis]|uniref:hypothetical protein n=1 Tax=Arthrobacter globiformis TaxID=1665 RepID=UPI0027818EC7|nr:hypothetical protein [Arthrobacter globiformis]MDQ0865707.1 hypothetical protein [Arthrobacter globiformis]
MNSQGTLFRISAISSIAGIAIPIILLAAFGGAKGAVGNVLTVVAVALLVLAAVAVCVALGTYREQGRKAGSTPLIYAVVAFPLGILLMFPYFGIRFPGVMMIALLAILTSVPALVIGIVKKLSVKAEPATIPVPELS